PPLDRFPGGLAVGRRLGAIEPRQRFGIASEAAPDGLDDRLAPFGSVESLGQGAQARKALDGGGRLHRDFADDVILEHTPARYVAFLRLALAPARDLDQHGELLGLADPRLQPFPSVLGFEAIGR